MKIMKSLNKIRMEVGSVLLSDCVSKEASEKPKQGQILSDIGALLTSKLAQPMQVFIHFHNLVSSSDTEWNVKHGCALSRSLSSWLVTKPEIIYLSLLLICTRAYMHTHTCSHTHTHTHMHSHTHHFFFFISPPLFHFKTHFQFHSPTD